MEAQFTKLKIEFGKPHHDWLSVKLMMGDFHLEFDASGVLNDPLADLVSCLLLVKQGVDASVSWWPEPAELSFQFSIQPQGIQVRILDSRILDSTDCDATHPLPKQQLCCAEGSYEAVILPFWRALRKLNPTDFNEKNWYQLPLNKLEELTDSIKANRQTG